MTTSSTVRGDTYEHARYREFHRLFPSGAVDVLDVGCNTGRGGGVLKGLDSGLRLTGLDLDEIRLGELDATTYHQSFQASSTSMPVDDASYDVVVAGEFIEHLAYDDVLPTLRESYRVLRPGGRLLLTTPNPSFLLMRMRGRTVLGGEHVSQHRHKALGDLLIHVGFDLIACTGAGRMTRYIGRRIPAISLYGSYMMTAEKPFEPS